MTTFPLPLNQVDAARLDALVANSVEEGRQLEYKEQLPGDRESEKLEFLKDVASFANTVGGDIIYGIKARRTAEGKPTDELEIVGLPDLNLDAAKLRLENMLRDGIAPRLPPVEFHKIGRPAGHPCLILRIPRSWIGPHLVTFKADPRFYARNSGGKYPLDVVGIREAFLTGETAQQRARVFRSDRVSLILSGEGPVKLGSGAKLIFHALPLIQNSDVWQRFLSIEDGIARASDLFPATATSSIDWRFNLDGFVVLNVTQDPDRAAYCQLFRDGGVEEVLCGVLEVDQQHGGFFGSSVDRGLIHTLTKWTRLWRQVGVDPPVVLSLTLTGVKGQKILRWPSHGFASISDQPFDRDVVVAPETVAYDLSVDPDVCLKPLLDYVWNGGGWESSPHYREGRWSENP